MAERVGPKPHLHVLQAALAEMKLVPTREPRLPFLVFCSLSERSNGSFPTDFSPDASGNSRAYRQSLFALSGFSCALSLKNPSGVGVGPWDDGYRASPWEEKSFYPDAMAFCFVRPFRALQYAVT